MFYRFVKLYRTKDIRDIENPRYIIISQEKMDFPIIDMIINKGVRIIINCVDKIYEVNCLDYIYKNNIKLYFLPKKLFSCFDNNVELFLDSKGFIYNNKIIKYSEPEKVSGTDFIDDFINNTIELLQREKDLLNRIRVSGVVKIPNDEILIISRGFYSEKDIIKAKRLIRKCNPTIIGVDGGSDIALKFGIVPHIVIGDMDSISLKTINRCLYFVVHCYLDGDCPGKVKVPKDKRTGYIKCFGTSEDAALLYSIHYGAKRIYTLGYHNISYDFLEKGRRGMSSSLLIKLKYGNLIKNISEVDIGTEGLAALLVEGILLLLCLSLYFTSWIGVFK